MCIRDSICTAPPTSVSTSPLTGDGTTRGPRRSFHGGDEKQVTVLIALNLSTAFDTVDHRLLLDRLRLEFGVTATVLDWLQSYMERRSQFVKIGQHQSSTIGVDVGVPQGSVLGPLLFAVYYSPVADVIAHNGVYSEVGMSRRPTDRALTF